MKRIFALVILMACINVSFASGTVITPGSKVPVIKASEIFIPIGKTGQKISLLDLSRIKIKELEQIRGKKMNFFDRLTFKAAQKKVRDNIDRDGTLNSKKIQKALKAKGGETGFHFGGFALGFFLGLIGVLIAYLINDDYKHNRVKWSWIGFGIALVINIILIVAVFNSVT